MQERRNTRTDKESRLVHSSASCLGSKKKCTRLHALVSGTDIIKYSFIKLGVLQNQIPLNQTPWSPPHNPLIDILWG